MVRKLREVLEKAKTELVEMERFILYCDSLNLLHVYSPKGIEIRDVLEEVKKDRLRWEVYQGKMVFTTLRENFVLSISPYELVLNPETKTGKKVLRKLLENLQTSKN